MSFSIVTISAWGIVPCSLLHSAETGHVTLRSAVNTRVNVLLRAHRRRIIAMHIHTHTHTHTHRRSLSLSLSLCNVSMEISTRMLIKQHTCRRNYAHYADLFASSGRVLLPCNHDAIYLVTFWSALRSPMFNMYHRRMIFGHNTKFWGTIYTGHLCP
jgi:hypothetical protein